MFPEAGQTCDGDQVGADAPIVPGSGSPTFHICCGYMVHAHLQKAGQSSRVGVGRDGQTADLHTENHNPSNHGSYTVHSVGYHGGSRISGTDRATTTQGMPPIHPEDGLAPCGAPAAQASEAEREEAGLLSIIGRRCITSCTRTTSNRTSTKP